MSASKTLPLLSPVSALLTAVALCICFEFDCAAHTAEDIAAIKEQVTRLQEQYKWTQAMPLAEKLVEITSHHYGHDSAEVADALHKWAVAAQNNGDHKKAEKLWLQALAMEEKLFGEGSVQTTRRLHFLGNLYRKMGNYEQAGNLLRRALALREKHYGFDHPETAEILRSLGLLCAQSADYAGAETLLARALSAFEKAGYFYPEVANTLNTMGRVAAWMGDHQLAEQRTRRSLEIREKFHGVEDEGTASSYCDLAELYYFRREFQHAIPYFQQALAIREKFHGTNHLLVAHVLSDLGASYVGNGDMALASSTLQRAYLLFEKHLGPTNLRVAEVIGRLSQLNERQGNLIGAKRLCDTEYDIKRTVLGSSHYYTVESLRDRVRLSALLGDPEPALSAADSIQQNEETALQNVLSFTSERQRLIYQQDTSFFKSRFRLWAELGAARPLARAIFRTKGLVLDSLLEDRLLAESSGTEQVRELTVQLKDARGRLTQLLPSAGLHGSNGQQSTEAQALCAEVEKLQAALARQVVGVGRARRALSIRLEDVQAAIPEHTVLLEMLRYRPRDEKSARAGSYGALIVPRDEEPRWVYLGSGENIDNSIKLYQHAVRNAAGREPLVHSLTELYRQLWAPLLARLPSRTKKIIISPDGELNFVSFAALVGPDESFLGEQFLFSYVACGRDLTVDIPESHAQDLVIWANPDFGVPMSASVVDGGTVRSADTRGLSFRRLPWAEREGRDLHQRAGELGFTNVVLHLGRQATEEQLLRMRSPKVLHLATHGFVLPSIDANAEGETVTSDSRQHAVRYSSADPLMRSGLALAGAQRTLQLWAEGKEAPACNDGIVTADDISVLDLRQTWLVVLAACDTGLGEARAGEGVLGLRRGFVQAGAQNLLLTLWPIDDERTRGLMLDFYTQLRKDRNAALALAKVQRTWLKSLRSEKGIAEACRIAGPFILSFQGRPE